MRPRPTVRLRLTLVYGALFLGAGALLLVLNYVLVKRGLDDRVGREAFVARAQDGSPSSPPRFLVGPLAAELPDCPDRSLVPLPDGTCVPADQVRDRILAYGVQLRDDTLRTLMLWSAVALGVMAVLSVGLGWLVAGRVLRPLQDITATARRLSGTNLHERIRLGGPEDELKELADTFDDMLARLDAAFDGQRRFVANASHELRTPLSIMRTEVDVTLADPDATPAQLREMAVVVADAVDRTERLIESLLVLARSERELRVHDPVDLADAAAEAADQAQGQARALGLRVGTALASAPVAGDRPLLERLAANLVENAVRHNRPGGWLELATGSSAGWAWLRVANSGPPVPPAELPGLFEPFRRLAPDRTGSQRGVGLGLSIVRAVVAAHGGQVRAEALAGGGLAVVAALPARR